MFSPAASPAATPPVGGAKWWGAGTGVSREEVLYGLPPCGVELALANGKKHVPMPSYEARSRAEIAHGLPMSGRGADLTVLGGRQKFPAPPPPVRSKIEALHGLPMHGRDADIALAGGRRNYPGAISRSGSAPPLNDTVRDLHLLDATQACGRNAVKKDRPLQAVSRRVSLTQCSPRARSSDGGVCSPCSPLTGFASSPRSGTGTPCTGGAGTPLTGGAASPRRGGAASPRTGGSPRAGVARRLSGSGKEQQSRRKLSTGSQQPPISEEGTTVEAFEDRFGACEVDQALHMALAEKGNTPRSRGNQSCLDSTIPCYSASPTGSPQDQCVSLASSASLASLTSELSQCINLSTSVKSVARTASTASLISPENALSALNTGSSAFNTGSALNTAVEDVLRNKMETAWQAICVKLKIPYQAPPPQARRRASVASSQMNHVSSVVKMSSVKAQVHPFRNGGSLGSFSAR